MKTGLAICTYRRPDGLRRLLGALPEGLGPRDLTLIVIDNDGADPSVRAIAEAGAGDYRLVFETERRPGISAARNRAISVAAREGVTLLAMMDDDEWPGPGWLEAMLLARSKTGAAVVSGVVEPVFPAGSNMEAYADCYAVRPQERGGRPFVHATSAVLLDLPRISAAYKGGFEDSHGLSGGGDLVYFSRLFDAGVPMAWAETALAYEEIPTRRATLNWLKKRRFRVGNHMVMDEALRQGRWRPMAKTLGLFARLPFYPLLGRDRGAGLLGWRLEFEKLRGRVAAHAGTRVFEYSRDGVRTRRVGEL